MRQLLFSVSLLLLLDSVGAAQGQPASLGRLESRHSGWCLGSGSRPGVEPCDTAGRVRLESVPGESGAFLIRSELSNSCLYSNRDGRFGWYTCTPRFVDQRWTWVGGGSDGGLLRAVHSDQCLYSNADGRFGLYQCTPRFRDQRWRLVGQQPASAIVGDWQWRDGTRTSMRSDGRFLMPNDQGGQWRAVGTDRFVIRWDGGRTVRVHLSRDGTALLDRGSRRAQIVAERWDGRERPPVAVAPPAQPRDCGTGLADRGCQETRNGLRGMEAGELQGLMTSLRATRSEVSKHRMIVDATRGQGITAKQLTQMLALFRSEVTQLRIVRDVVSRVIDPRRALGYAAQMRSSVSRERLTRMLTSQSPPEPVAPAIQTPQPRPAEPTHRCPPLPACGIGCDFGQARDENGCTLCACNPNPLEPTTRP